MHLYDCDRKHAEDLIAEGYQARVPMPPMPIGDPWPSISATLDAEKRARAGEQFDANDLQLSFILVRHS